MKVAITGATGFIGRHLAEEFRAAGHEVVCCGRSRVSGKGHTFAEEESYFTTDYSVESLREVFRGCEQVVHLAGISFGRESDFESYTINVELSWNALSAAHQAACRKVVLASSRMVYSKANGLPWDEEMNSVPDSLYGASKLALEKCGGIFALRKTLDVKAVRIAQVAGVGTRAGSVLDAYLKRAESGLPPVVFGDGAGRKDYVYIKDLVTAVRQLAESDAPAGPYNIGSGESISVGELAEAVRVAFAIEAPIEWRQDVPKIDEANQMSIEKIKKFTGWCPHWPMKAALQDMRLELRRKASDAR